MAVQKNFTIRNGIEVNNNLLVADSVLNRVGVGTTTPNYTFEVIGGIGVTDINILGISTVLTEFNVGTGGTVITALNNGLTGFGTPSPEYVVDIRSPVSTGQTALYVQGDVEITGDLYADDINLDQATFNNIEVTGVSTFAGDTTSQSTLFANNLSVAGFSTFSGTTAVLTNDKAVFTVGQNIDGTGEDHFGIYYDNGVTPGVGGTGNIFTSNGDLRLDVVDGTSNIILGSQFSNDYLTVSGFDGTVTVAGLINADTGNIGFATITVFDSTDSLITKIESTNVNVAGIGSITTAAIDTGYINTGIVTNLVTTGIASVSVGVITHAYITTGVATNFSVSGIGYITTAAIGTGYINTGIVTNLSGTNLNYSGVGTVTNLRSTNLTVSGVTTSNSYNIGATQVISSSRELQNIVSLDATTTATIETAIANAPNTSQDIVVTGIASINTGVFTSLYSPTGIITTLSGSNINYSGIGSFGSVNADIGRINTGIVTNFVSSGISTLGSVRVSSGVITATSGIITYYGDGSKLTGLTGALASTYGDTTTVPVITVDSNGRITSIGSSGINFSASTVAQAETTRTISTSVNATHYLTFVDSNNPSGAYESLYTNSSITFNPAGYFVVSGSGSFTGIVTASSFSGNASSATYATNAGIATYATTAGIATVAQGLTGTPNINVGVVTATSYNGSGINLTGIVTSITAGSGISVNQSTGNVTITATGGGGGGGESYWVSTAAGIHTLSNVGIGTTIPTTKLDVEGDASISGFLGVDGILYKKQTPIYFDENNMGQVQIVGSGNNLKFYNPVFGPGGDWIFDTSSNGEVVRITNSGNVGIGTTNPTSALTVQGDVNVYGVSTFQNNVSIAGSISLGDNTLGDNNTLLFGNSGDLKLYHNGTVSAIRNSTGELLVGGNVIRLQPYDLSETYLLAQSNAGVDLYYDNSKKFETLGAGVTITGTTFTNQLNVSGVSTLTSNLYVLSGIYDNNNNVGAAGSILSSTGSGVNWVPGGLTISNDTSTDATRYLTFTSVTSGSVSTENVSSTKLQFNPSSGNLSATQFTSLSDATQKTNVRPIENPIEITKQLDGVRFDWINNNKPSLGLIAQEVEKVLPELVETNSDGIKSVSYSNMVGLLIEAIKEQQVRIEELERKLNA